MSALEAYRILAQNRVRSLPIVDDRANKVVANLSCSDLRGIHQDTVRAVVRPLMQYLHMVHGGNIPAPVVCTSDTVLLEVMQMLLQNKIHRVWVTRNDDPTFIGVVSITDVIYLFAPWHNTKH